jgi:enterochelin esterase-like enzyme
MVSKILKYLNIESTPIITDGSVTFIWKGSSAPLLSGDFTGWDEKKPIKMVKTEPGIWTYQHSFDPDAYIEYGFIKGGVTLLDPLNPQKTSNGEGGYNSFFSMPEYIPTNLSRKKRQVPHGTITCHSLPTNYFITGTERRVHLYHPPVTEAVPLVVVWDGQDYLFRVHLNNIVDNLIQQGRIRPIALAFVDSAEPELRTIEYTCNDATLGFLMTEVIPLARKQLKLIDIETFPGNYGVLGASMGGLMALYTGARIPQVFGNVFSQSGAFSWGDFDMVVFDLLQQGEVRPLKVWLDVGLYDLAGILLSNQRMQEMLNKKGYALSYREYHAGHNYPAWRDEVWRGFETLYGVNTD